MNIPILFLIYNRPDTTHRVFESIRAVRPPRFYIASDGPREDEDADPRKVKVARNIATQVDWPCEVKTLFRDRNLGCKSAVSGAITWFFKHEEQGIILEDDCLPHPDFFAFCESLLDFYNDEKRILSITGNNFQAGYKRGDSSYYFSKYSHCWGWATWQRAWKLYDQTMRSWSNFRDNDGLVPWADGNYWFSDYWTRIFNAVVNNNIDTWDYQWTFSCWLNGGLTCIPNSNLVKNIGFGEEATHTKRKPSRSLSNFTNFDFPLRHPYQISRNLEADRFTDKHHLVQ